MPVTGPIPLPGLGSDVYKDVMDYFETIQRRRSEAQQAANDLAQRQKQFEMTNALERQKAAEMASYHQAELAQNKDLKSLQFELLKQKIIDAQKPLANLSPQERAQAMKLVEAGRSLKSMSQKAKGVSSLLEENPDLTGIIPGSLSTLNLSKSKKLAEFDEKTRKLQADIARYGSQRGGAQALRWSEKAKPGMFRQGSYNIGMTNSILEDAKNDYDELKSEYEALTGQPYPISLEENQNKEESTGKVIKWKLVNGKLIKENQ